MYSKTCVKRPISKRQKIGFQFNAGQKYCRMLQVEHSAILSTFIKLPIVIKIFVLSIFEWFYCFFSKLQHLPILTLIMLGNFRVIVVWEFLMFSKNSFRNTTKVSNNVGPDLCADKELNMTRMCKSLLRDALSGIISQDIFSISKSFK